MRKDLVVTKANNLVEASYKLSVSEQRVIALLAAQVQPQDEDFKPYRFKASDLQSLIESSNKDEHQRLKVLSRGLLKRTLQIKKSTGWLMVNWLSSAEYIAGEGEVELCFDPKLKPYMLQLKERFTTYKLLNVVKLRSRYSVRLYELLKQYEASGKRTFELSELRRKLSLTENEYATWKDFRVNVLTPASRELPKKTDLRFSYTARKKGRAIYWLDFKIWSPVGKGISKQRVKELSAEASACWIKNKSSCRADWANHQAPADVCHWCKRFEAKRAELAGQQQLPLSKPKQTETAQPPEQEETKPLGPEEKATMAANLENVGLSRSLIERLTSA